jgi:hypothetical protein
MESHLFFKNLVAKWVESVELFRWQNFKLFLLGCVVTFFRSLTTLIKYFWWLLVLYIASLFIFWSSFFDFTIYIVYFVGLFLSFFSLLALRPSIENKNLNYFVFYFKRFFPGFLVVFLMTMYIDLYLLAFLGIISLFFFDTIGNLTSFFYSIINAFKMFFYFFPGFLILGGLCGLTILAFWLVIFIFKFLLSFLVFVPLIFVTIFIFLAHFFFLSIWTVYYIRIKHQDFQLFIKE